MFKRYPYWGWLLLSVLLWCINGYQYHMHRQAMMPEQMARQVNNDLHNKEVVFEKFLAEQDLIHKLFTDTLSEKEFSRLNKLPFYFYCYDRDTLIAWNTNTVIKTVDDSAIDNTLLLKNEKGAFLEKCILPFGNDSTRKIVVLFPILVAFPLENNYLHSHFVASPNIPLKTKIIQSGLPVPGAYAVKFQNSDAAFYLQFNKADLLKWVPDSLFIAMLIAALLASLSWIQLMIIYVTRRISSLAGSFLTIGTIVLLLTLYYKLPLPFNLDQLTFFDSKLYASNALLSCFADLSVLTICLLWLVVFIIRHTPYRTYFADIKSPNLKRILAAALTLAMYSYVNLFITVIRDLVLDSSISFDVSHFYAINIYTILGLLVIGGLTGISCVVVFLFNIQINCLIGTNWFKYILIAIVGIVIVLIKGFFPDAENAGTPFEWDFYWLLYGWLLLFIYLLDKPNFTLVSDLFKPHMVFWAIFICAFSTVILQYFNQAKERETRITRIAFLKNRLSLQRDYVLEYSFQKKADKLEKDKTLKSFFYKPSSQARKALDQHLNTSYLTDAAISKYQPATFLFDADQRPLFNRDTIGFEDLMAEKEKSEITHSSYLFYNEGIHDQHFYLSYIPVYNDTVNKVIGYVLIDLDLKKQVSGTVYPELLQTEEKISSQDNEYAVGVYINDKLYSQTNDYPFPTYLKNDTLKKEDDRAYHLNKNVTELYYKLSGKRTLVVIHYHSALIEMITLFSYIFVILVLLAAVVLLYQLYLSYFTSKPSPRRFIRLTLRRRVHFSMLGVVLLSFIIIGFVTILFFKNQYQISNAAKLQSAMQVARESVQDYLKKEHAYRSGPRFDSVTRSTPFKSVVAEIAHGQKIDLNIYNRNGILVNTSEDDIYEKGLISGIMRSDAYYQLSDQGKSILIQEEQIADLSHLSAYLPILDDQGIPAGYINVPFLSSEKDLNYQISSIVVTLINLYAFIFLISSLFTVVITRWITGSFSVIIKQFGMLNLQQNERISWPYDDEIGLLVSEYNKMVNKVEENAARLAQSERESAWREMARQVAHEIKNPLTPMKLNIQFLQQAMRNDNPNIKELTEKLSGSIIEQIDNLSYIASEFSNFAKMPEARPEILELGELLNLALKLYVNDVHIQVNISACSEKILVYSDRSQLLRVFTNLLENAKQAIPEDRKGVIDVCVITEHSHALISIRDNGVGIDDEAAERIFQPYFTTKSSGTGLGLAMTRKIIEFWKGSIWFETKAGEGTVFFIRLPEYQATPLS